MPLVRLMIHWGVGYKDFSVFLKSAYLHAGKDSLRHHGKSVTASSLSVATGIHRKDAAQFLKDQSLNNGQNISDSGSIQNSSWAFTVLSKWATDEQYIDLSNNKPIALPYSAQIGGSLSFVSLCEALTKDVRPRSILDELLRLELVRQEDDLIYLRSSAFIPQNDLETKVEFFARNISEHIDVATCNLIGLSEPKFERMASHDGLTVEDIAELREIANEKGMALLREIYQLAEMKSKINNDKYPDTSKQCYKFSLGVFVNDTKASSEEK